MLPAGEKNKKKKNKKVISKRSYAPMKLRMSYKAKRNPIDESIGN